MHHTLRNIISAVLALVLGAILCVTPALAAGKTIPLPDRITDAEGPANYATYDYDSANGKLYIRIRGNDGVDALMPYLVSNDAAKQNQLLLCPTNVNLLGQSPLVLSGKVKKAEMRHDSVDRAYAEVRGIKEWHTFIEREIHTMRFTVENGRLVQAEEEIRTEDYVFRDLSGPADLADILLGRQSQQLPHVVHSTDADNVFFFWSGHGADNGGPLWGDENSRNPFGPQRIRNIVEKMPHRRMMLALESCYSGQWGEALTGVPDVIVLTAANAYETSKPDVYNADMGTYLSNAFSRAFLRTVGRKPSVSIADLYYQLARTTSGSHVTLYNIEQYGSVNKSSMSDYFIEHH